PARWEVAACRECRARRLAFSQARAAVAHRGAAVTLLRAWKDPGLALGPIAAAAILEARPPPPPGALLCPGPGDAARVGWRGVDGPADVAARLGEAWALPVARRLLVRRRDVAPQRGLGAAERRRNLRAAFTAADPAPALVVLVDDVYTTGATAE